MDNIKIPTEQSGTQYMLDRDNFEAFDLPIALLDNTIDKINRGDTYKLYVQIKQLEDIILTLKSRLHEDKEYRMPDNDWYTWRNLPQLKKKE